MNDFVHHVRAMLYYDQNLTLEEIGFRLSEIPCAPLEYGYPREAVLEVFDPTPRPEQFKRGSQPMDVCVSRETGLLDWPADALVR
jgi:hypothetical protein